MIACWPDKLHAPGRTEHALVEGVDLVPTLLDLMGLSAHIPREVEGVSHAPLLLTGRGRRPSSQLYLWVPYGKPASGRRGVRTHGHTLMISKEEGKPTRHILHDNVTDPFQLKNIAEEKPRLVERLVEEELKGLM